MVCNNAACFISVNVMSFYLWLYVISGNALCGIVGNIACGISDNVACGVSDDVACGFKVNMACGSSDFIVCGFSGNVTYGLVPKLHLFSLACCFWFCNNVV